MIQEYRIGNLIADYECEPYYFPIEEIKKNSQGNLAVYYRNGSFMSIEPNPIELTEEWLLKFGFKDDNAEGYFYLNLTDGLYIYYNPNSTGIAIKNKDVGFSDHSEFIFFNQVHQLQNLYFALTNEELTLKQ
jgi:hypothetical protein